MKKYLPIFLTFIILFTSCSGANEDNFSVEKSTSEPTKSVGYINELLVTDFFSFKVNETEENYYFANYYATSTENTILRVNITVTNIGTSDLPVGTYDFKIKWGNSDSDAAKALTIITGNEYPTDYTMSPGETLTADLFFEVSLNRTQFALLYEELYDGYKKGRQYYIMLYPEVQSEIMRIAQIRKAEFNGNYYIYENKDLVKARMLSFATVAVEPANEEYSGFWNNNDIVTTAKTDSNNAAGGTQNRTTGDVPKSTIVSGTIKKSPNITTRAIKANEKIVAVVLDIASPDDLPTVPPSTVPNTSSVNVNNFEINSSGDLYSSNSGVKISIKDFTLRYGSEYGEFTRPLPNVGIYDQFPDEFILGRDLLFEGYIFFSVPVDFDNYILEYTENITNSIYAVVLE
ncbi:MAG: DUF4352 domain-containing protein [Ruminococcus sp.]|jgi:hypothetical protein|nr:DUF4352 domain-containing protein [Ruminococcus sp.]